MSRRLIAVVVGVAAVVALVAAFRQPLARLAVEAILSAATGTRATVGEAQVGSSALELRDLKLQRGTVTLLAARRVAAVYDLRDLLPGGKRRYGIQRVELDAPVVTLHRNADGGFDLPFIGGPKPSGPPPAKKPVEVPLQMTAIVRNGRLILEDPKRHDPVSRTFVVDRISADASVDTAARTTYAVNGTYEAQRVHYPLKFSGLVDNRRGIALHGIRIATLPLREIANYFIDNGKVASLQDGFARNLDVRFYSLGESPLHIFGGADLSGVQLAVTAIRWPLQHLSGHIDMFDDGFAAQHLTATLGGAPLELAGGMFAFADPRIRLGVRGDDRMEHLRSAFDFSSRQPVSGEIALRVLLEGHIAQPLILTHLSSPGAAYRALPIAGFDGTVAYYNSSIAIVPFIAQYGGIGVQARGALLLGPHLISDAAVRADGPATAIPYAAESVPAALIHVTGLLSGLDGAFAARGIVDGAGGGDTLNGLFHIDSRGNGELGPILASRADGSSLAGAFILDRPESRSAFWLDAHNFSLIAPAHPPILPGLPQISPPNFSARIDARIAGVGPPSAFALAGNVRLGAMNVGGVRIDSVDGTILGSPSDARLAAFRAVGPWGAFAGDGAFTNGMLGARGEYRGTFQRLESFTGKLGAIGSIAAPVALLVAPHATIVQTERASTADATVHGIPLDDLSGTLSAGRDGVRIFAARARVSRANLAAAGAIAPGRQLGLAVADADARGLSGIGLPLAQGTVSAIGAASLAAGGLRFDGGALIARGLYERYPVAGNGDVSLDGAAARLARIDGRLMTVFGNADGHLSGIGSRATRYDMNVRVRGADLGDAASEFGSDRYHLDGSADADLHIGGAGAAPQISGRIELPEATVNGLFIDHAAGDVSASPASVAIDGGTATVGSTVMRLSGALHVRRSVSLTVAAQHADLSDFDNFFDPGDLLSGRGAVALSFSRERGRATTGGDVSLAGLRVSHFDVGDAVATWTSAGSRVTGRGGFIGRLGRLDAGGSVELATRGSIRRMASRSRFDLFIRAGGLDIGAWLPALGYDLPVGGTIDATGTLNGRFPQLALSGTASVNGGTFGKLPIDRLTVSASSSLSRTTITDAQLEVGGISARGSGSFGYAPSQPMALALHASSPDIGTVVTKLSGNKLPLRGALEADVRASGRFAHPLLSGGFDIEKGAIAGVQVPRALGEFGVSGSDVELRDMEVAFATGTLYVAGSIPLTLSPIGFGPPKAPITLEAAPRGINLADFASLMPQGSSLQGTLNGRVAVRGTVAAPSLEGQLALAGGELVMGGIEQQPLRNIVGSLTFSGSGVTLDKLHADAGSGSIDVTGSASVPDLVRPGGHATYAATAKLAHALLDIPTYGKGQIDGTLTLTHVPEQLAVIGGAATVQDAAIPFSALYSPSSGSSDQFTLASSPVTPHGFPNVAFDLGVTAGRNVRVRSSVIDIGGTGAIHMGGTLAAPELTGSVHATNGTVTYFNTVFRLLEGTVTFVPGQGIVPILDARASTHVINPDPNLQRNLSGSADITLSVRGPVTNLTIGLDSDPPYDRQQILGLLLSAPAIGASNLFETPALPGQPPPLAYSTTNGNGTITVGQTAFGVLNAQFTRSLLAPIETSLGGALGLSNLNFTLGYTGSVGFSARKLLGKNLYAVYGTTFGYPYRQTFGFELRPTATTAAQFTFYQTIGEVYGYVTSPVTGAVSRETLSQPVTGLSGFSFSLQRFLW